MRDLEKSMWPNPERWEVMFSSGVGNCWNLLRKDSLFFMRWTMTAIFFLWILMGVGGLPGMAISWGWGWNLRRGSQGWESGGEWELIPVAVPADWLPQALCYVRESILLLIKPIWAIKPFWLEIHFFIWEVWFIHKSYIHLKFTQVEVSRTAKNPEATFRPTFFFFF